MLGIPQEDPRWVFWRAATAVPGTWDIPPVRRHSIRDRYKTWEILGELLGGLEHIGNVIIPNDELIFFRGVAQPPTSLDVGDQRNQEMNVSSLCFNQQTLQVQEQRQQKSGDVTAPGRNMWTFDKNQPCRTFDIT